MAGGSPSATGDKIAGGTAAAAAVATILFTGARRRRFVPLVKFILSVHPRYQPQGIAVTNIHEYFSKHDPGRYGKKLKAIKGVLLEAVQEGVLSVPKGTNAKDAHSIAAVTLVPGRKYVLDTT